VKAHGVTHREPNEATPWSELRATLQPREYSVEDDTEDYIIEDNLEEKEDIEEDSSDNEEEVLDDDKESYAITQPEEEDSEDLEEDQEEDGDDIKEEREDIEEEIEDIEGDKEDAEASDDIEGAVENDEKEIENPYITLHTKKRKLDSQVDKEVKEKAKKPKVLKCKICGSKEHLKRECDQLPPERRKELQELYELKVEAHDRNKNKLPYENKPVESKQKVVNKSKENESTNDDKKSKNKKAKKPRDWEAFKKNKKMIKQVRKYDRSGAMIEDGECLFHGFRVLQEDQIRLTKLFKELKKKGLTKEELTAAIKRERRIAEKRLDKNKRMQCYKCRKTGHLLADCPLATDASENSAAPDSGICFKCGSLEHKSKECNFQVRGKEVYKFATCFICKEEGHLSKACPDNPRGRYPDGGGCKECGSVEHLLRDCPVKQAKILKKEAKLNTETIHDGNIEVEDEQANVYIKAKGTKKGKMKKPVKVIKF